MSEDWRLGFKSSLDKGSGGGIGLVVNVRRITIERSWVRIVLPTYCWNLKTFYSNKD